MLVLRRKVGEAIILDGPGRIVLLAVEGERVKLGITADPGVSIVREELLHRTRDREAEMPVQQESIVNGQRQA